jgi:dipeptidyl aminopeptidase/acylaminoacyl peptidase
MRPPTALVACLLAAAFGIGQPAVPSGQSAKPDAIPSFFGLDPPGPEPAIFAPGVVSTALAERDVAISPDGRELYFSVTAGDLNTIMVSRLVGARWTAPEVAPFAADARYYHFEPCVSPDGRRIFFLTYRPGPGEPPKPGWAYQRIWASDRSADGTWGDPYDVGAPVNGEDASFFPSMAADGTLYFTLARTRSGVRDVAIYRAKPNGRAFAEPERLPAAVNGYGGTFNAFVSPDERYLIAGVTGRDDGTPPKAANYYVFFRRADGGWSGGTNLGPAVNRAGNTTHSASVSPDGRYFFFASNAPRETPPTSLRGVTLARLVELSAGPGNGRSDIYWANASLIHALLRE